MEKSLMMKAPNGNPTNLTPEQYRLVRTLAFKKWFGGGGSVNSEIMDLSKLSKKTSYDDFLSKTDSTHYNILYRGGYLSNQVFMTDYIGHAREYGDVVDGIVYNQKDLLYFNDIVFNNLRNEFNKFNKQDIKKIYLPFFKDDKLFDAMVDKYEKESSVISFVFKFINSNIPYSKFQQKKIENDLLIPIMLHYAKNKNKNIISFIGGDYADYGGAVEFVVNDISKYTTLKDIWEKANIGKFNLGGTTMRKPKQKLLAPNGKQSNLTPEQYKLVRTPEFKAWFGDWENSPETASKVVDSNGEPLVAYHSGNEGITVFDKERVGSTKASGKQVDMGFYFGDKETASLFDRYKYETYEVFLNIRTPYYVDVKQEVREYAYDYKDNPEESKPITDIWEGKTGETRNSAVDFYDFDPYEINNRATEQGCDGFIVIGVDGSFLYNVFEPTQIKLADGSNTTFDSSNPDVRFDGGGTTNKNVNLQKIDMEKQKYCVVVVKFDNNVKKTSEVMPIQMAKEYVKRFVGKPEECEVFACTADGEQINKIEDIEKYAFGGGVDIVENESGVFGMFPEKPNKKTMGVKMRLGGNVDMESLQMDLNAIKQQYPSAEVSYTFAKDSSGKGYVITAKENGKTIYTSYKMGVGGTMDSSMDTNAPILMGTMGSSMKLGGKVKQYEDLSKQTAEVVNDSTKTKTVPEIDINFIDKTEFDGKGLKINSSQDAYGVFKKIWDMQKIGVQEEMNVLFLNKANIVVGYYRHSMGGIDGTVVDKELICGLAVKSLAKGVIIAHNHPSGNLTPSPQDLNMTKELDNALRLFNITLLDSLILVKEYYRSLKDEGNFELGGIMRDGGNLEVNNDCIKELINLIKSHKKVDYWVVDKNTNNLVILLKEEIDVYDVDIYNQFLKGLTECSHVFEDEATLQYDKKDYKTIFIKLKTQKVDNLEMKNGGNIEDGVTHDNVSEFKKNAPEGYAFSKKKMTALATKRLGGYWLQTANINDVKREIAEDREKGYTISDFQKEWLLKYQNHQQNCFNYLKNNGFLKKAMRDGGDIPNTNKIRLTDKEQASIWDFIVNGVDAYGNKFIDDKDYTVRVRYDATIEVTYPRPLGESDASYEENAKELVVGLNNQMLGYTWEIYHFGEYGFELHPIQNAYKDGGKLKEADEVQAKISELKAQKEAIMRGDGLPNKVTKMIDAKIKILLEDVQRLRTGGTIEDYKIGESVDFEYGKEKELKSGTIIDKTRSGNYVVSTGFSQIGVGVNEIIGLSTQTEKKKFLGIFKGGGNMNTPTCERCGGATNGVTTMSMFSEEVICMPCKQKERLHPDYQIAVDTENEAVKVGNYNFKGIAPNGKKMDVGGDLKKKDSDDISQYYDNEFALGTNVPNIKQKQIITEKIGLNEQNADYFIGISPKFAVWLADVIVKDEIRDYKVGLEAGVQVEATETQIKQYVLNRINERNNWISSNYGSGIRQILDWLMNPITPKQNLRELSFRDAFDKAKQWHDELKATDGDFGFSEPEENEIIKTYPISEGGTQYYWVLIPKSYCPVEQARMGHCGRTGGDSLISLRSHKPFKNGVMVSTSHVTVAYDTDEALFYQVKGKENKKPIQKYHDYIFDLIKDFASDEERKFKGFGVEYDPKEDYGFEDMSKEQVLELYQINPYIFNDFEGECLLYELGISDKKPNTTIIIDKAVEEVDDLLKLDRGIGDKFVEKVLTGEDTEEWFDGSWSYYYQNYSDLVGNLDKENEARVIKEIMRLTKHSKEKVEDNGILYYLDGEDENFEQDVFDNIIRSMVNATTQAEQDDYMAYYKKQITNSLEELGVIQKLNYEGLELEVHLSDHLTNRQISAYKKDATDLEDVFFEALNDGQIETPSLSIDDRYSAYAGDKEYNAILKQIGLEDAYKLGGTTKTKKLNWTQKPIAYGYFENNNLSRPKKYSIPMYATDMYLLKHKNIEILSTERKTKKGLTIELMDLFYGWDDNKQKDGVLYFGKLAWGNWDDFPKNYKGKIIYKDGGNISKKEFMQDKIGKVMHEFKHKELRTPQGKLVTNPKQAIAIGYSAGSSDWKRKRKK
jgi:DNA repair protein RadC